MTVDIDNTPLKQGDMVMCIESSIILAPYCTSPYKRPSIVSKKKRKKVLTSPDDTEDSLMIKHYNASMRDAKLVRDEIVGLNTIKALNPNKKHVHMQWYKIKHISNGHISFYRTSDTEVTRHFHPANKFKKVR